MSPIFVRHSLFHVAVLGLLAFLFYQHFAGSSRVAREVFPEVGSFAGGNFPTHTFASGTDKCPDKMRENAIMVVARKPPEYYMVRENCRNLAHPVLLSESEVSLAEDAAGAKGLEYRRQAYQFSQ